MSEYECYENLRTLSNAAEAFVSGFNGSGPKGAPITYLLNKETRDKLDDLIFALKEAKEFLGGEECEGCHL